MIISESLHIRPKTNKNPTKPDSVATGFKEPTIANAIIGSKESRSTAPVLIPPRILTKVTTATKVAKPIATQTDLSIKSVRRAE